MGTLQRVLSELGTTPRERVGTIGMGLGLLLVGVPMVIIWAVNTAALLVLILPVYGLQVLFGKEKPSGS